jgi:nucleotide-binding universal stress UspA family protein
MFKRITVAYSESPESRRALASAIHLARILGAELQAVTIVEAPPAYTAYADAVDPSLALIINSDRMQAYERLRSDARQAAEREGVALQTHLLQGEEVDAIVGFLDRHQTDLLVIGLHRRESHISRLWSTVYGLAQNAPCSVLGVH